MKYLILFLTFFSIYHSALGASVSDREISHYKSSIEHDCKFKKFDRTLDDSRRKDDTARKQKNSEGNSETKDTCEDDTEQEHMPFCLYRKLLNYNSISQSLSSYNVIYHFISHTENFRPPRYL